MFTPGFFNRFKESFKRVVRGVDFVSSLIVVLLVYLFHDGFLDVNNAANFVESATPLTTTLVIVLVTSISVIGSLSDSEAVKRMKTDNIYGKFLFTFEIAAMLALFTSVLGVIIQSFEFGLRVFYVYLFFFTYTVLAAATTISNIITYGDKLAMISILQDATEDSPTITHKKMDESSDNNQDAVENEQ